MLKIGTGGAHVAASRSKCCRVACAEPDWAVCVWESVRRKVRVAKLTVNPQMARTITRARQRGFWYLESRKSSEGATGTIILQKIITVSPADVPEPR